MPFSFAYSTATFQNYISKFSAELARKLQEEEQQAAEAERETVSSAHPETPGTSGPRPPSQSSQSKKKENVSTWLS